MFDFADRVVLITGAAGNLGGAVAHAFGDAGARLALVDVASDRLEQVCGDLVDTSRAMLIGGIDQTAVESVGGLISQVIDRLGRIDILVNPTGGYRAGQPVHQTDPATWELMLDLNATSAFLISRAVVPHMLAAGGGKIVHVAARQGLSGSAGAAAYAASKSMVIRLTESMAAELKHQNINVNCVLPGTIDTPQNRQAMPDADFSRWVEPQAIADAILFLCSPYGRAVQGAALAVYGRS
jgi:NAD(P)-dependent dehydrogenase (short-subunit alcohol dehydrogenase family)